MGQYFRVYPYCYRDAEDFGELDEWKKSFRENIKCSEAIERVLEECADETLAGNAFASITKEYGYKRVNYVLAATLKMLSKDVRFSEDNKKWAQNIYVPKYEENWLFCVQSDSELLDQFITQVRCAWDTIGFYNRTQCVDEGNRGLDYQGKVVVISPYFFSEKYQKPEFQLFLAETGFGCSPTSAGTKIFGTFLADYERTYITRGDVIGVMKDECLPSWAVSALSSLRNESPDEENEQLREQAI